MQHIFSYMKELHRRSIGEPSDASVVALRPLLTRIAVQVSIMYDCIIAAEIHMPSGLCLSQSSVK